MTAREMFYSGERRLSLVFTSSPWKVFLASSLAGCILLLLPAWLFRLHSIPTAQGNLGLFFSYNWSLMYPVVIPLLLAMAVAISERMKNCVIELQTNNLITRRDGRENLDDYSKNLSRFLRQRAKWLVLVSLGISIVVTLVDTHNLWVSFIPGHLVPTSRRPEWDTAFNVHNWGEAYGSPEFSHYLQNPPTKLTNFLLDLSAYTLQTVVLFFAFFWVGKFLMLLFAFAKVIGNKHPSYEFHPLTTDLNQRMGLAPMGALFDSFLAITVLIEAYAFYHRLHLIKLHNQVPLQSYVTSALKNIIVPKAGSSWPYPLSQFSEIFKTDSWAFHALDVSAIITILLMTLPILVVCFLPMWRIRKVVEERRKVELRRLQAEYSLAVKQKRIGRVQVVEHEKRCLENANIWPNGDHRAKRYLTVILALAAGAIAPPLLAIVIIISVSESATKYFKFVFSKKAE
jgi:hypothetical protein